MNLEDLNLSYISKKASMTDLSSKGMQQLEWEYSDCLRINNNNNNNKENILGEIDLNKRRDSTGNKKSIRKSSFNESSIILDLQERNRKLELINNDNEQKLKMLDQENEKLREQLQLKELKRTKSIVSNTQKQNPPLIQSDSNIPKPISQLQNIPESESEETPLNRPTLKGYQRNTISFTQYSADYENSEGGSKKKKKSEQKIKMILNNGGMSGLGTSVRRLFVSSTGNNTPSSASVAGNQSVRNSIAPNLSDNKYESISSKVDSNLEKKLYHEEILRKNKQKFNNNQSSLNTSLIQNDSNDLTMISFASAQNSNIKPQNQQLFNNDDTISKISCYEDLNHLFNGQNQNQGVKLKYYSYLLEESFFQHERFAKYVAQQINNEQSEFQALSNNEQKQNDKLLKNIELQSKQIETLKEEVAQHIKKSEQLTQLVLLYKKQIEQMNSYYDKIQDELSTLNVIVQFEDLGLKDQQDFQLNQCLESVPSLFQNGVERIKQNVNSLQNKISEMDRNMKSNNEEYCKQLEILNKKLENQLSNHDATMKNKQTITSQNVKANQKKDIKGTYQKLSETVEKTIQIMIDLERDSQKQKDTIYKSKLESENLKKHYETINSNQKNDFDEILEKLQEQFKKLKKQQTRLEEEIFEVKLDKKRIIYQKLGKKLECKFKHSSKPIEEQLLYSLGIQFKNFKGQQESTNQVKSQISELDEENKQEVNNDGINLKRQLQNFNEENLSLSLYQIVINQHENLQVYKKALLDFMKIFEWLEICVEVDFNGNLKLNQSFLSEIKQPELVDWAIIFKKNIEICIQQFIKRQVDSKIDLKSAERNELKKLIYSGNYSSYFALLIKQLNTSTLQPLPSSLKLKQ